MATTTTYEMFGRMTGEEPVGLGRVAPEDAPRAIREAWLDQGWDVVTVPAMGLSHGQEWRGYEPTPEPATHHDCGREYSPKGSTVCWYCHS